MPGRVPPLEQLLHYLFLARQRNFPKRGLELDAFHQLQPITGIPDEKAYGIAKMLAESTAPIVDPKASWADRRAQKSARDAWLNKHGPSENQFGGMNTVDKQVLRGMKLRKTFDGATTGPYGLRSEVELSRDMLQDYMDSMDDESLASWLDGLRLKRKGGRL